MSSAIVERTFMCKCGGFQAKLTGDPALNKICRCHSCMDDKEKQDNDASILKGSSAGCSWSLYRAGNVDFVQPELKEDYDSQGELMGFVNVDEKGTLAHAYTKCCATHCWDFSTKCHLAFNSNCIYERDGSLFQPLHESENVSTHAFDESNSNNKIIPLWSSKIFEFCNEEEEVFEYYEECTIPDDETEEDVIEDPDDEEEIEEIILDEEDDELIEIILEEEEEMQYVEEVLEEDEEEVLDEAYIEE